MVETTNSTNPLSRFRSRVTPTENDVVEAKTKNQNKNGDLYVGTFRNNLADGVGKYLRRDGYMYEGEWKNGKADGKGKLSLPGGGTYEGEFKSGKMEGNGTYIWENGCVYKGNWVYGKKQGNGEMWYSSGDYYNGGWKCNLRDGVGKYVWNTGGVHQGVWRNGVSDSDDLDGCLERDECENGDVVCDIGDACYNVKKPGETICKGHKNYDLMLRIQLGISYSVEKYGLVTRELNSSDFNPNAKFWTRFPPEGSKLTPTHRSTEFRWKDYCPVVFRHLRDLFQVNPGDYMLSVCGNDALRELFSPGKSGSFFYLTQDDRFMIKTVKKPEVKVLLRMLPSYYRHICHSENSLMTRFYGVHCVKPAGGSKTRFIVMGNLFCSEKRIHRRFDLKGSRHGRTIEKTEDEIDETTTLKDLDLDFVFRLQRNLYQELMKQIERDCEFLEAERIMDYSLLVGIHFRENNTGDKRSILQFIQPGNKAEKDKYLLGQSFRKLELQNGDNVLADWKPLIRLGVNMPARAKRLARESASDRYISGGYGNLTPSSNGEIYEVILYLGIIDILQDYDMSKRIEHAYKSLQVSPTSISAVDPKLYSKRFLDFMGTIFMEDEDE